MSVSKQLLAVAAATMCFGAFAQSTPTAQDTSMSPQARYEQERAACVNGTSHQDKTTCLREAGAARNAARQGGLTTSAQLDANAMARCNALPEADRDDCRSRVQNQSNSTSKGTVEGGGIIKETTTRWVMTPEGEKRID